MANIICLSVDIKDELKHTALNISSANSAQGSVNSSVNKSYTESITQASRTVTKDADKTLVANFKVTSAGSGTD